MTRNHQRWRQIERDKLGFSITEHLFVQWDEQWRIVKLDKLAAFSQPSLAFDRDVKRECFGQHDKRNARNEIVHPFDTLFVQITRHFGGRVMNNGNARLVGKLGAKVLYKYVVDLEQQQTGIRPNAVENITGNDPIARTEFDHDMGMEGVNFFHNGLTQIARAPRYTPRIPDIPDTLFQKL
jgi:hypothetical protein